MITEQDLTAAIAECQGKRNPDAKTCIMLAAFYTIKREMFGEEKEAEHYSFAQAPEQQKIELNSGSEFADMINGKELNEVFPVLDELMGTIKVVMPRLYNAVIDKLS